MKMEEVEGIGPIEAEKLALAGIATAEALLEMGRQAGRPGGDREGDRDQLRTTSSSGSTGST